MVYEHLKSIWLPSLFIFNILLKLLANAMRPTKKFNGVKIGRNKVVLIHRWRNYLCSNSKNQQEQQKSSRTNKKWQGCRIQG